jgi:hypothetical protein
MIIFEPRNPAGQRVMKVLPCEFQVFLRWTPGQPAPDLVFPRAGFVFNVYRWIGNQSWYVETLIDDVNRTGQSPCDSAPAVKGEEISRNFDCYASETDNTYDLKSIIQIPAVRARLRRGLGDLYQTFLINLTVRGPWRLIDNCLAIQGNAPHRGDTDRAILALCRGQNHVYAALLTDGAFILLAPKMTADRLPTPIRGFLGDALDEAKIHRKSLTWID